MKKLTLIAALLLTGCSFIMPVPYDPAGGAALTDISIQLDKVSCIDKEKNDWQKLVDDARWLDVHADWKQDPQAKTIDELYIAIQKARDGSTAYCDATIKLQKTRVKVLQKAWKGR
jgi:hypothetical protein